MDDIPPDPPEAAADLGPSEHRLTGPLRAAVRRPDRGSWLIVSRERLRRMRLPLGLMVELGRSNPPRDHSRTTEPAVGPGGLSLPLPPLPAGAGALVGTVLALLAVVGFAGGNAAPAPGPGFAAAMVTFQDLAVALGTLWLVVCGLLVFEGALLADQVQGTAPLVRIRRGLPRVEPVAWRLGIPASVAVLAVLVAMTGFAAASGWYRAAPAAAAGAGVGALLYTIRALYPLRPGPGARILEALTRLEDLPSQLRWALVERFLPLSGRLEAGGTRTMAVAALALAAWAAGTGQALHLLTARSPEGLTAAGSLWRGAAALGLATWAGWLVIKVGELVLTSARIGSETSLESLEPPEDLERAWIEENPLNRHVPGLRSAPWSWAVAPRGTVLIRHGGADRDFFWVARGAVHVVGRTEGGDPLHLATAPGGLGIGEIALLGDGQRTADVIAAEDSVVAILKHEDFVAAVDEEGRERFREVVLASQALARAPTLWGLSPELRARWISHGKPAHHEPGEIVIEEGDERQWVGLVVRGRLAVEKADRRVATLGPDRVFGEMAYLTGRPRSATLRAEEPTLVWRWDARWLDRELVRAGAADELRELARGRARDSG